MARAEQAAGHNPEALLFPALRGGMWWSSSLSTDLLVPAMKAAGWKFTMVQEMRTTRAGERKLVEVTQMHHTWHSLRHRFARDMIDHHGMSEGALMAIGGWDNIETVTSRYYRTGRGSTWTRPATSCAGLRHGDPTGAGSTGSGRDAWAVPGPGPGRTRGYDRVMTTTSIAGGDGAPVAVLGLGPRNARPRLRDTCAPLSGQRS